MTHMNTDYREAPIELICALCSNVYDIDPDMTPKEKLCPRCGAVLLTAKPRVHLQAYFNSRLDGGFVGITVCGKKVSSRRPKKMALLTSKPQYVTCKRCYATTAFKQRLGSVTMFEDVPE